MKYTLLSILLIALSCGAPTPKKATETNGNKTMKDAKNELIAVLKYPKRMDDAKQLIKNSGLTWDKLVFDKQATKIALIKVPAEKRDFWIEKLMQSGEFKTIELNQIATLENIKKEIKNSLVSFRKTPCHGHCPVFEVRIDKDGKVFYNGIKYVLIKGKKEFQLTDKQFSELKKKLNETSFSSYKNSYNNPRIMDLPSTYISHNQKEIQLRVWSGVPTELTVVCEYIEDILLEKKCYEL